MKKKVLVPEAKKALKRASGTIGFLEEVAPEALIKAKIDLAGYRDAASSLDTKAAELLEHLAAVASLLPAVQTETRQLQRRSRSLRTAVRRLARGKRKKGKTPESEAAVVEVVAPAEPEVVAPMEKPAAPVEEAPKPARAPRRRTPKPAPGE